MPKQAFIFDLDGTLLDTLPDIAAACNETLAAHGIAPHPVSEYSRMLGNGFAALIKRAAAPLELSDAALAAITDDARKRYAARMTEQTRPYEGMEATLAALADHGAYLAVLSNKPDAMTVPLISHYFPGIPFARVCGAREGVPLKPHPQALLAIIQESAAENALYVGDSDVDMITARNAGCAPVGAAWGFRGADELAAAGAGKILARPRELLLLAG